MQQNSVGCRATTSRRYRGNVRAHVIQFTSDEDVAGVPLTRLLPGHRSFPVVSITRPPCRESTRTPSDASRHHTVLSEWGLVSFDLRDSVLSDRISERG